MLVTESACHSGMDLKEIVLFVLVIFKGQKVTIRVNY